MNIPAPVLLLLLALPLAGCTGAPDDARPDLPPPEPQPAAPQALHTQWTVTPAATVSAAGTELAPGGEPAIGNCVLTNEVDGARIRSIHVDATWDPAAGPLDLFAWSRDAASTSNRTSGTGRASLELVPQVPSDLIAIGVFTREGAGLPIEVALDLTLTYDGPSPAFRAERCVP